MAAQAVDAVRALHNSGGAVRQELVRQRAPVQLVATLTELADNGQTLTSGFDAGAIPAVQVTPGDAVRSRAPRIEGSAIP